MLKTSTCQDLTRFCSVDKEIDFDAMLAADQRKHKHAKAPASGANGEEGHKPDSSDGGQIEEHGGSDDGDESDGADESGGNEESGGDDAGEGDEEELLPTEDDFLRLEDMEKFVQVCGVLTGDCTFMAQRLCTNKGFKNNRISRQTQAGIGHSAPAHRSEHPLCLS